LFHFENQIKKEDDLASSDDDEDEFEFGDQRPNLDPGDANAPSSLEEDYHNKSTDGDDYWGSHDLDVLQSTTFVPECGDNLSFANEGFQMTNVEERTKYGYHQDPQQVFTCLQTQIRNIKELSQSKEGTDFCLPMMKYDEYFDPIYSLNNDGQREFLCSHLKHLEEVYNSTTKRTCVEPLPLRQLLIGVAGTGKSFVMKCNRIFYRLLYGEMSSERSLAPTGKSAGGIGGVTLDRGLSFTRTHAVFKEINANAINFKKKPFEHTNLLSIDEQGMIGAQMYGHIFQRCNELFNKKCRSVDTKDPTYLGGIEAFCLAVRPL